MTKKGNDNEIDIEEYSNKLTTQLRKGFLTYCVLIVCSDTAVYSSEIINRLQETEMIVVEGTLYPLLNRLQKDRLLEHEWQESEQGPPRKYYQTTKLGTRIKDKLAEYIDNLNNSLDELNTN